MIIDIHAHCFPNRLAAKAIANLVQVSDYKAYHNGTVEGLTKSACRAGFDYTVVQPVATRPDQTPTINRWAFGLKSETLLSFGTIHPAFSGWAEEIKWLKDAGFRGIKMHPEYQGFFVDDPHCLPIYEAAFSAGLMILFHAGADIAYKEPYRCPPARLAKVLDALPGGMIIAAHMGGYRFWDDVEKYLTGRSVFFDTSFSLPELGPARMIRMIRNHGSDKILFGTDSPWTEQSVELSGIQALDLNTDEKAAILGGNAARLLLLKEKGG